MCRRFKDFAELNSQVKQNFKGHHLRSSLPPLPEKTPKFAADHLDPAFIQERRVKLQYFLRTLLDVPHVAEMTCVKSFLGLMEQVKEVSYVFRVPKIGLGLVPSDKIGSLRTAVVSQIISNEHCLGVEVGDVVSRVNGVSVTGMSFRGEYRLLHRNASLFFISSCYFVFNCARQLIIYSQSPYLSHQHMQRSWLRLAAIHDRSSFTSSSSSQDSHPPSQTPYQPLQLPARLLLLLAHLHQLFHLRKRPMT